MGALKTQMQNFLKHHCPIMDLPVHTPDLYTIGSPYP